MQLCELSTVKCYCCFAGLHLGGHSCSCEHTWPLMQNTVNFHLVEHDRGWKKSQTEAYTRLKQETRDTKCRKASDLNRWLFQHLLSQFVLCFWRLLFSCAKVKGFSFIKVSFLLFTLLWHKTHRPALITHLWSLSIPNLSGHIPLCLFDGQL